MELTKILIVHHSPTETVQRIADVVLAAAREAADVVDEPVEVVERHPLDDVSQDELVAELLSSDAVLFGTTANFGYISGALKHYFDVVFVPAHEKTAGLPTSWWIRGGYDTTGAAKAMRSLTTGMEMSVAAQPVEFTGEVAPHEEELAELAQNIVGAALGV